MPIGPVDWQSIHSRPLIAVSGCWQLCGGGVCCSGSHSDFLFRLIPKSGSGTVAVYLEDEYAWMRTNGHIVCGEEDGAEVPPFEFDLAPPHYLLTGKMSSPQGINQQFSF